ncbi:phosphatase PAP2 family protein [Gemmatimonadota bacterium]
MWFFKGIRSPLLVGSVALLSLGGGRVSAQEPDSLPRPPWEGEPELGSVGFNPAGEGHHPLLRPFIDLGYAGRDFGVDAWRVASSPARLTRKPALQLGAFVAVGGVLAALDESITDQLRSATRDGLHGEIRSLGDFFEPAALQNNTNAALAGVAVLAYLTKQRWLGEPAKQILYSQWISGLTRHATGAAVGRLRPYQSDGPFEFEPGRGKSFPSGHSAAAMEIATVLSHHLKSRIASVALYTAAATVVFQRVDDDAHWASDAWFGAGLGIVIAKIVIETEEARMLSVRPAAGSDGRIGLSVSFSF